MEQYRILMPPFLQTFLMDEPFVYLPGKKIISKHWSTNPIYTFWLNTKKKILHCYGEISEAWEWIILAITNNYICWHALLTENRLEALYQRVIFATNDVLHYIPVSIRIKGKVGNMSPFKRLCSPPRTAWLPLSTLSWSAPWSVRPRAPGLATCSTWTQVPAWWVFTRLGLEQG